MTREQFLANVFTVKQCSKTLGYLRGEEEGGEYQEELEDLNNAIDSLVAFYDGLEEAK